MSSFPILKSPLRFSDVKVIAAPPDLARKIMSRRFVGPTIRHLKQKTLPAHDGNRKRDVSLETSLRMYHTL